LYSFHMDKVMWTPYHVALAPTGIFPYLSSATHPGIALETEIPRKIKLQITWFKITEMLHL
jgi:hypothetical protein